MNPRLVATGGENLAASRTRISKVIFSNRSRKSSLVKRSRQITAMTLKAIKAGMHLAGVTFTVG